MNIFRFSALVVGAVLCLGPATAQQTEPEPKPEQEKPVKEKSEKQPEQQPQDKKHKDKDEKASAEATEQEDGVVAGIVEQVVELTTLMVTVTTEEPGQAPINNARVMVTYEGGREFDRRTDELGVAELSGLPRGKVDIDVTAPGMRSYGASLDLKQASMEVTCVLKSRKPASQ